MDTSPTVSEAVAHAASRLEALPAALVSPELADAVTRRAVAEDAHARVADLLADTAARQQVILDAVRLGHLDEDAVDRLATLGLRAAALTEVRSTLPDPGIAAEVRQRALGTAQRMLAALEPTDLPVVRYLADVAAWKAEQQTSRILLDPPVPTDLDREAAGAWQDVRGRHDAWLQSRDSWRADAASTNLPELLDLLVAAAGLAGQAEEIRQAWQGVAPLVTRANRARKDAGLQWEPPRLAVSR